MTCNLQRKIKFTITLKIKKIKIKKRTKNAINNIKKNIKKLKLVFQIFIRNE